MITASTLSRQLAARLPCGLLPRLARKLPAGVATTVLANAAWDALHSHPQPEC
jgi:hypothetical protein